MSLPVFLLILVLGAIVLGILVGEAVAVIFVVAACALYATCRPGGPLRR